MQASSGTSNNNFNYKILMDTWIMNYHIDLQICVTVDKCHQPSPIKDLQCLCTQITIIPVSAEKRSCLLYQINFCLQHTTINMLLGLKEYLRFPRLNNQTKIMF